MEQYIAIGIRTRQDDSGQTKREPVRELITAESFALALKDYYRRHQADDYSLIALILRDEANEVQRLL